MFFAPPLLTDDWSPLLDALWVPILLAQLYVGRASLRATSRDLAGGSVGVVIIYCALIAGAEQH